ncbi:MAG TPA: regulatory protein RecX [Ignavibacteriaceae bacterium]|nr:regulatory protein RecX [Ignavibacteriaceae bacterium]
MKIDRVIRKDEKNVIVFFDNDEKLILSEDVFFQSGLRKGDEVSEDRFSFFVEQNILYHIKHRALSFLSRRFHSERELMIKLKSKLYDERLIKIVLSDLKEKGFIDDRVFAQHFVEEKLSKKRWGKNKIKAALLSKGVNSSIIEEALLSVGQNESEFSLAFSLAEKKLGQLKKRDIDEKTYRQKITSFLISRGFDFEVCREVCEKIIKDDFN